MRSRTAQLAVSAEVRSSLSCPAADDLKGLVQLLRLGQRNGPRLHQAITWRPGNDMDVQMENVLPPSRAVRLKERQPRRIETCPEKTRHPMDHRSHMQHSFSADILNVIGMLTRDDQRVAFCHL